MHRAVHQKFTQYRELYRLLVDTGDTHLVEHTTNDDYWGDGGQGKGQNKLGQILMKVRSDLIRSKY